MGCRRSVINPSDCVNFNGTLVTLPVFGSGTVPSMVHVLSERRAAPRYVVDLEVKVQTADRAWHLARMRDVSIDGARITLASCSGALRLRLATDLGPVEILARSVRTTEDGTAVEYIEMSIDALERYSRWLDRLVAEAAGAVSASS